MEFIVNSVGIILLLIIILLSVSIYKRLKLKKTILKKIEDAWGQIPKEKYHADDMTSIASFYLNKRSFAKEDVIIDDITWNDLDLEKVFKRLNYVHSSVGEEYLYNMLRTLVFDENILLERGKIVNYFSDHPTERKKLQYFLEYLGKHRHANISNYIGDFPQMSVGNAIIYKGLATINVLSILLTFYNQGFGILLIISFLINMTVYYRAKSNLEAQLSSMSYIARLINISRKITKLNLEGLSKYTKRLIECNNKLNKVGKATFSFSKDSGGDPLTEYIRIILLTDLNNYNKTLKHLKNNQIFYKELYETIGFLDNMVGIAAYRSSLKVYCEPKLKNKTAKGSGYLKTMDIYHPLILEPVTNSIFLEKSLLLTGSNASGKSTFLKSLAINAIFAQTIFTCLAREYHSNYYIILTSMALRDDLSNKESYFIAEIKSLKRILDKLNENLPCLCFVDEILRGTNTIERIASSSRVLEYLANSNCISIAATHDIELTKILEEVYENYHFQEKITEEEIVFDYKLYNGRSKTRNAIKLLKLMGFEKSIVEAADKAAFEFEQNGSWSK